MRTNISRRDFLHFGLAGLLGSSASGWFPQLARAAEGRKTKACILLWMSGGPAQQDTFDPKPDHENGGEFKPIATSVPGIQISEHLPGVAQHADTMAIIRSLTSREGDHGRATYVNRTGNLPMGSLHYPTLGSLISKELGDPTAELPNFVSIAPSRFFNAAAYSSGFLGPKYAPLMVGEGRGFSQPNGEPDEVLTVRDLARPVGISEERAVERLRAVAELEDGFVAGRTGVVTESHRLAYERAMKLMQSDGSEAFDLKQESTKVRDRYGRNVFGQGCLLARRLVERGVPFVEVGLFGWDTHSDNFEAVKRLSQTLDPAWAALMSDLSQRGLLDDTLIVWMGEFGRTPRINGVNGRDHFPNAYSAVLAGGGINGGQVIGRTSVDGMTIEDRPVQVIDLLATICQVVGVDHKKTNDSNIGRPIRIVDQAAEPIREVLA